MSPEGVCDVSRPGPGENEIRSDAIYYNALNACKSSVGGTSYVVTVGMAKQVTGARAMIAIIISKYDRVCADTRPYAFCQTTANTVPGYMRVSASTRRPPLTRFAGIRSRANTFSRASRQT